MGKHETGYACVERDLYPTREPWVVTALDEHVDLRGAIVWECACGHGSRVGGANLRPPHHRFKSLLSVVVLALEVVVALAVVVARALRVSM
jgi:hypothetical protein